METLDTPTRCSKPLALGKGERVGGAVNPYSIETRYMLDIMCYQLHAHRPRSVRIASDSVEMVKAVGRRLAFEKYQMFVPDEEMRDAVRASLGLEVQIAGNALADAALCPFSISAKALPAEQLIVASLKNALSYKSLLRPGSVGTMAFRTMARVRNRYHIQDVIGLYPPRFIAVWTLANAMERWNAAAYYRLSDIAMQHLYEFGPLWRLSYVVVFTGKR